jgi:chemotaxis protein methyltransferase CheR
MQESKDDEVVVLLNSIFQKYGQDFRSYSPPHIRRRIENHMRMAGYTTIRSLQRAVLDDPASAAALLQEFRITVTEMFRDPPFFLALRELVMPLLRTWSHIRIWHAGCSTGEEVYSMAILLKEEGLLERTRLYATDIDERALEQASRGIYPVEDMKQYARNYQLAGGTGSLSDHFLAGYDAAIMDKSLKRNIVWSDHNLATDGDFAEVQLVVCRNVMIYFERDLQRKVHQLFDRSLVHGGILCLGSRESIDSGHGSIYNTLDRSNRIYRKKYPADQGHP